MNTTPNCTICSNTGKRPGSNDLDCSCPAATARIDLKDAVEEFSFHYDRDRQFYPDDRDWFIHQRARQIERQEQAARIAELERQLAEASAPAVEPQPVAYMFDVHVKRMGQRRQFAAIDYNLDSDETLVAKSPLYTAPQAADTDKVREAISKAPTPTYSTIVDRFEYGFRAGLKAASDIVANMEAQAPVREVPDMRPGVEAVISLIQKQCDDYHREHGSQEPDTGVWNYPGDGNEWMRDREELLDEIRALLPAAPVQQEGESNG